MKYEKLNKRELIELLKEKPKNTIENCNFTGVQWDKEALVAVNNVSKSLLNMTELFKSQNVTIKSMIKVKNNG
tara:strand:+ start:1352 stop:1570 length:219 start_codon:yes stop_codon:yes gene_type:complete